MKGPTTTMVMPGAVMHKRKAEEAKTTTTEHSDTIAEPVTDEDFSEDYKNFKGMRRRELTDLFDKEFLDFGYWLRKDIGKKYTRADFMRINYTEATNAYLLCLAHVAFYIVLHKYFEEWRFVWRYFVFLFGIVAFQNMRMVHSRMHWAGDMTGCHAFDVFIDSTIMVLTGCSKEAFRRRHVDEHMADISNIARLFGEAWLPFLDLPALWYLRPFDLVRLMLDEKRCKSFEFDRRQLLVEVIGLYGFLISVGVELYMGSNFLLCYHMVPMLVVATARLMTGMFAHSGVDRRNSFNACAIFDWREAKGLFKVTIWLIDTITDCGLSNHSIHHGHAQCPVSIVNPQIRRINKHILENYRDVRYNRVLSHEVHANLLARLPEPKLHDYIIQFFVSCFALAATCLTILGVDISPTIFELPMVDYRVIFHSTQAERFANFVAFFDSIHFVERARAITKPHHYMIYFKSQLEMMKQYLRNHADQVKPVPYRRYAPEWVYEANGISLKPVENHGSFESYQ